MGRRHIFLLPPALLAQRGPVQHAGVTELLHRSMSSGAAHTVLKRLPDILTFLVRA